MFQSDGDTKIQAVIEAGVCRRLVELLNHASPSVQTPALRTVGNIVTGDDLQTQAIIDVSALPSLLGLLSSPIMEIRKEACWIFAVMVEKGANLDAADKDGKTALMMAIDKGMVAVAALMVERGANLDAVAQRRRDYSDRFKVQLPSFELCRSRSSSLS